MKTSFSQKGNNNTWCYGIKKKKGGGRHWSFNKLTSMPVFHIYNMLLVFFSWNVWKVRTHVLWEKEYILSQYDTVKMALVKLIVKIRIHLTLSESNSYYVSIPDYYSAMSYSRCVLYNERSSNVTEKTVWEELIGRLIRGKSFIIQLYLIHPWLMNIPIN